MLFRVFVVGRAGSAEVGGAYEGLGGLGIVVAIVSLVIEVGYCRGKVTEREPTTKTTQDLMWSMKPVHVVR